MEDNFKFEVGSIYENVKGSYEVLSIRKNSMVIRWHDGSEITTTVDLQMRIIERMALEKKEREKAREEEQKKKSVKAKKNPLKNSQNSDEKSVAG